MPLNDLEFRKATSAKRWYLHAVLLFMDEILSLTDKN